MTTIGNTWRQRLNIGRAHVSSLYATIDEDEQSAEAFFAELRDATLASHIARAAEEQKSSITLEAPGFVLGTDALSRFISWAKTQHLDARLAGLIGDGDKPKEWRLAMLVRPLPVASSDLPA